MRLTWGTFYVVLFLYRCVFSVVGQTVILRLTSVPDTTGYQTTTFAQLSVILANNSLEPGYTMQSQGQVLMAVMAAGANLALGGSAILMNIAFQSVAFAGLLWLLVGLDVRTRAYMAALIMTPSFSVWSSLVSKEALVVGFVCVVARYVVDLYSGVHRSLLFHVVVLLPALALIFVFKPHFMPAIVFAIGVTWAATLTNKPATVSLLAAGASIVALYLLRTPFDRAVRAAYRGIVTEPGRSSRRLDFFQNQFDVFANAPEGMWRAFVGPTMAEASDGLLHRASYLESVAIIVVVAIYVLPRLPRLPVYMAVTSALTLFWILFANYPLGIANPGTAVRYRTDYLILVFLAVVILVSRPRFVAWREQLRFRTGARPVPAGEATGLKRLVRWTKVALSNGT